MKALEILKNDNIFDERYISENSFYERKIEEEIAELEEIVNKNCTDCKHLAEKENNLKFECLIEVCRTCSRSNKDNWELKQ